MQLAKATTDPLLVAPRFATWFRIKIPVVLQDGVVGIAISSGLSFFLAVIVLAHNVIPLKSIVAASPMAYGYYTITLGMLSR